jgi:DNA-binding transcriptional LysR family regulator
VWACRATIGVRGIGEPTAELALSEIAGLERGALTIYASQTIASYWLPPRLVSFRRAHPRVTINLVARNTAEVASAVQDGAADLGLVEGRVDADDLIQQAVARDRLALVVSPTHPWASRRNIKASDLLAAEWVLRERGSGTRSEFEDVLTLWSLSAEKLNVVLELPSNEAVRMAVEAGAGATVISRLVVEPSLRAGSLKVVPFDLPDRAFTALRHRERYFSKGARSRGVRPVGWCSLPAQRNVPPSDGVWPRRC